MFESDTERPVRPERTGWRDLGLSDRHRQWGFNCPAVDLDFVLCEYDEGRVYAIVEYKCQGAAPIRLGHPTMRALTDLANRAKVPFFVTIYSRDFAAYRVQPINYYAQQFTKTVLDLNETPYINFLLHLRGRQPNGQLF